MILLVDDHSETLTWMQMEIQDAGYYCDCASYATMAFYKVERLDYALALIDIGLPDYPGNILAKLIRNSKVGEVSKMPLVAMSGSVVTEDREFFDEIMMKPFDASILHDVILKHARPPIKDLHIAMAVMADVAIKPPTE